MKIYVYSKPNCVHCQHAKDLLSNNNKDFEELVLGKDWNVEDLRQLARDMGHPHTISSVPQIVVGDRFVGGLSALKEALEQGL